MGILWLLSSLCFHRIPSYSEDEFRVVAILFSLLVITRPLMRQGNFSGLFNKLNLFGHTVSFLVVVVFFENTELKTITDQRPNSTEDIYIKTIAEKFAYEKRLIVKELKKNAIHTILTAPEHLTVNTINKYLELKSRGLI